MNALHDQFTDRERAIMEGWCGGASNHDIAKITGLSHSNVVTIGRKMVQNMGLRTTRQATYVYGTYELKEPASLDAIADLIARAAGELAKRRLEDEQTR